MSDRNFITIIISAVIAFAIIFPCTVYFTLYFWNTYLAKRDQARMAKDSAFRVWLDKVEARLQQYGANRFDRTLSDWLIDFESGLSPDLAAKNLLGREKRAPR